VWEETGVPGENPRGRAGDDLIFPYTTPVIEPGSHWREASALPLMLKIMLLLFFLINDKHSYELNNVIIY